MFSNALVIVGETTGMGACLAVHKLHLSEDWIMDTTQVVSCAHMTVVENTGMDVCLAVPKLHLSGERAQMLQTCSCSYV